MIDNGLSGVELYSERMFPTKNDVLEYEIIYRKARVQVYQETIKIFNRYLDQWNEGIRSAIFERCIKNLKRRHGVLDTDELLSEYALEEMMYNNKLKNSNDIRSQPEFEFYTLLIYADDDHLLFLDLIELLSYYSEMRLDESVSNILDKLINEVFHNNGIGYEIIENKIIHKGNDIVHKEIIRPSLQFLSDLRFKNANDEMLKAFYEFKRNEYRNAIQNASNAFESTMKIIIEINNWHLSNGEPGNKDLDLKKAPASLLISTIKKNSVVEGEGFNNLALKGLNDLLQSLSTLRNNHTGHGKGSERIKTYKQHCEFALHTAAANILYLIKSYG